MSDQLRMEDDKARTAPDKHPGLWTWIFLALLTILAGAIRFYHIAYPALWYDESMVFRRTCGSYAQLLDCLRVDGFVPLHYSLVWVISHFVKPTPLVLRFFPALCGTLMVPAVFFLARQMLPRGTALLAAAFTACSAFMLFYSRDAKMYMDSWLFVALNSACLLWWLRTGKSTAWLCWIASGCAACGLQTLAVIPVVISLLLLFTQRRMHWRQAVLWLVGVVLILSGPLGYYEKFNRWQEVVDWRGRPKTGLEWVVLYNHGRTGPELVRLLGTSTLMGWEWPTDDDIRHIQPERVFWPQRAAEVLLGIFIIACLPWPRSWQGSPAPVLRYAEEPAWSGEPQWRVALWLSLWILVPVYAFYCWSMPGFATPTDWWAGLLDQYPKLIIWQHQAWFWCLIGSVIAALAGVAMRYRRVRPMLFRGLGLVVVFAVLMGLFQLTAMVVADHARTAAAAGKPISSIWVPRYLGFICPMLAVLVAALLMRLPTRWVRGVAIIFVLGLNLVIASFRIVGPTEPPVDLMAADVFDAQDRSHHTITWTRLKVSQQSPGGANIYGEPGQYYLQLLLNKPTDPVLFLADKSARVNPLLLRMMPWDRTMPAGVNRIILWSEYTAAGRPLVAEPVPPSDWVLRDDQWFTARDCWIWQDLARYRRSVFVKIDQ